MNCAAGLSFLMTRTAAGGEQAKTRQFCAGPEESEELTNRRIGSPRSMPAEPARGTSRGSGLDRLYSRNSRALLCRSQECCTR